jgi:hypothetical protein
LLSCGVIGRVPTDDLDAAVEREIEIELKSEGVKPCVIR